MGNKICPTLLVDTSSLRAVHISSRALCVSLLALPTADKHSAVGYSHTRNVCCMQYTYVWVKDIVPSSISIHSYPPHSYLCLSVCVYMRFVCDADQLIPNAFPSRRGEKHTYNRIKRARATRHPRWTSEFGCWLCFLLLACRVYRKRVGGKCGLQIQRHYILFVQESRPIYAFFCDRRTTNTARSWPDKIKIAIAVV